MARTRQSVCARKRRFVSREAARADIVSGAQETGAVVLFPYRCDRGDHWHLTSRSKGRRME